jgi:lipopolysaccharide export system protein LptA
MNPLLLRYLAAALLLAAPGAFAERADREKEIVVGADRLTADDANKVSTFEGSVVITQGTMRMTANKVTVKEDADRHKVYVANGTPVTFRQKRDKVDEYVDGSAERAEFDDRTDVLRLFNRARVKSNQNEITGDFISYDMNREVAEVSGAPPGQKPLKDSRVKVIITPPKKAPDSGKADPGMTLKPDTGAPPAGTQ